MRSLIVLLGLSITGMSLAVSAEPMPLFLQEGQAILSADRKLLAKVGTKLKHRLVLIKVPGNKRDRFERLIHWWMEPFSNDAGHYLQ